MGTAPARAWVTLSRTRSLVLAVRAQLACRHGLLLLKGVILAKRAQLASGVPRCTLVFAAWANVTSRQQVWDWRVLAARASCARSCHCGALVAYAAGSTLAPERFRTVHPRPARFAGVFAGLVLEFSCAAAMAFREVEGVLELTCVARFAGLGNLPLNGTSLALLARFWRDAGKSRNILARPARFARIGAICVSVLAVRTWLAWLPRVQCGFLIHVSSFWARDATEIRREHASRHTLPPPPTCLVERARAVGRPLVALAPPDARIRIADVLGFPAIAGPDSITTFTCARLALVEQRLRSRC